MAAMTSFIGRILCLCLLLATLPYIVPAAADGRVPLIPASDPALEKLGPALAKATAQAQQCTSGTCPDADCDSTSKLAALAAEMTAAIDAMRPWMEKARADRRNLYFGAAKNLREIQDRKDELEGAIRVQDGAMEIANTALAIASLTDMLQQTLPKILEQKSKLERLKRRKQTPGVAAAANKAKIEGLPNPREVMDAAGDVKDLLKSAIEHIGGTEIDDSLHPKGSAADDQKLAKSLQDILDSDIIGDLNSAQLDLADFWEKKSAKDVATLHGLVQVAGKLALKYAEKLNREMQEELADLKKTAPAVAENYERVFGDLEALVARDAALERLAGRIDQADGGNLEALTDALTNCPCGAGITATLPEPQFTGYGDAIRFHNGRISEIASRLAAAAAAYKVKTSDKPVTLRLKPANKDFKAKETFDVRYSGPVCALREGQIAIMSQGGGNSLTAALDAKPVPPPAGGDWAGQEATKVLSGSLPFNAPEEAGPYEARFVTHTQMGALAAAPFRVKEKFKITDTKSDKSAWVASKGAWLDLRIRYIGDPKPPIEMHVRWRTCPPRAQCKDYSRVVKPYRDAFHELLADRFGFCTKAISGVPSVYDNEIKLRDADGDETPWKETGARC